MVPNTNDGTQAEPYLRTDLNMGSLAGPSAPTGEGKELYQAIKDAGFKGLQGGDIALCKEVGLGCTAGGRINEVGEIDEQAQRWVDEGYEASTLHVGWGLEDNDKVLALVEDICKASEKHNIGIYIETHRATITQDIWRSVWITEQIPDVRFNADFSHWYTGLEMVYGGIDMKMDFMAPIFDRVRFFHGRIGNPGNIQVDIGDGTGREYVDHFREMWTRSCEGFLKTAQPGDFISFNPELLAPEIYYARTITDADGNTVEEGDRWQQSILYSQIALECFEAAKSRLAAV